MAELPEPTAEYQALTRIAEGDRQFESGDRAAGVASWRTAEGASDHPAIVAMVALRLVHVEGTLAPLWREAQWTKALEQCPISEPICQLARADEALFLPRFAGGNPAAAADILDAARVGDEYDQAITQRRAWSRDGARWIENPGTWNANLGFSYAQLSSLGILARFTHPDLGFRAHRLDSSLYADLSGTWAANARWTTPGPYSTSTAISGSQATTYAWTDGTNGPQAVPIHHDIVEGQVGVRLVRSPVRVWTGISARFDELSDPAVARGGATEPVGEYEARCPGCVPENELVNTNGATYALGTSVAWAPNERFRTSLAVEAGTGSWTHLSVAGKVRGELPLGPLRMRTQLALEATPLHDEPWWRWPSAGGANLLRGLPAGRYRAPVLSSVQAELSHRITGPLEAAIFVDSVVAGEPAWTAGGGVRLVLPPGRDNTTRLDVGAGPDGWGAVLSWGDAF